ncbi:MAG: YggS family pyridoxal phosphate-dependent enzyme [Candidatus Methanoperedens sp.]
MNEIQNNINNIKKIIHSSRDISILAVTKTRTLDEINSAIDAGIIHIGENYVEEAYEKYPHITSVNVKKHFIGHLQSNKARRAVEIFDVIQTVDSIKLLEKIDSCGKKIDVMLQVNTSPDSNYHGIYFEKFDDFYKKVLELQLQNVNITGLMTIASENDPRICFKRLYNIKQRTKLGVLSMGMSHDYEIAIEEGATMIRLGTKIFGKRKIWRI